MKYHLIGDRGISMRGIKKYLEFLGNDVTGSDLKTGGHAAVNVTSDIDLVVRTSAVNPGSPGWVEVEAAQKLGIKIVKRSELIGQLTKDKKLIAISGMHGKTTTTAMAGLVMIAANLDPTVLIGEEVKDFDNDVIRIGESDWFVFEACEYDRSFLDFYPKIAILTNIEAEHLDTYPGGLSEIKDAFVEYLNHLPDDGVIIACHDDANVQEVLGKLTTKARIIDYGFTAEKYNQLDFDLAIPGKHNVLNTLAVVALADYLHIKYEVVSSVLAKFRGAHRRFELKGNLNGADLIDDYGHHPTEIKTTIAALAERYPDKKKIVVFWPHQYKRIKPLLEEFGAAFSQVDEVIIKPIYFVPGRDEVLDISSDDLVDRVNRKKNIAKVIETDEEIAKYLRDELDSSAVLLTIGIPPVYKIADLLLESK
ncbi:UDP-N-acetylmuramate--L-alanine ligase [Candidatus Berkelbacteria bacterium CG10_big_fil_rev_8_21_14_0_10_43_13]|uniref:UDP-N-acetylmuramate--L-alanine ligase n=1 Tax=Candidatus Berkelbacteria bacterium CG10_big_fil_rev_8_21_14_0_10_43_13 TaxID=1974514 RepID=A0A2H0W736_9BACT|nr:MAG: UDP-N-acetylmuramate--L-alanine ligase [Candidatus Berkelbacteria bacterium CG10_big_fil_rev_8_21_14_0_10_43_13]